MGSGFTDVLTEVLTGLGAEELEAALEMALDGSQGCVECGGNFARSHVLLITENDGGALGFGQSDEQLLDARAEGRGGILAGDVVMIADLDPVGGAACVAAAKGVCAAADGDATQPEERVIRRVELAKVAIHFKKDILGDFFGEAVVAGDAEGDGKDHGLVLVHELFEVGLPARCHEERLLF